MTQKRYREYLYAVHHFTKKKKQQWGDERAKLRNSLTKLKTEKRKLVQERATLISKDLFDLHSKEIFTERIEEITEMIFEAEERKRHIAQGYTHQVKSFHQFLELRANLVQYWKSADYPKKAIFSKITFSNLILHGQKVAKISLKKPFSDEEEGWFILYGAEQEMGFEPTLDHLWNWLRNPKNEVCAKEISQMIDSCRPAEKLKYPLLFDIAKISGTKV